MNSTSRCELFIPGVSSQALGRLKLMFSGNILVPTSSPLYSGGFDLGFYRFAFTLLGVNSAFSRFACLEVQSHIVARFSLPCWGLFGHLVSCCSIS